MVRPAERTDGVRPPLPLTPSGARRSTRARATGIKGEADDADDEDGGHQLGIGEAIPRIEDEVAEPAETPSISQGTSTIQGDADGHPHAGEHMPRMAGKE